MGEVLSQAEGYAYAAVVLKKKLGILAAAAILAVVLAEVVLRVFFGGYITQIYALDEETLHRLIPGEEKLFVHHPINGGAAIPVRINEHGFRGEPLQADGTTRRVVVFGDSFVMSEVTVLADTFVERLEQRLGASSGRVNEGVEGRLPIECVNAGVVAYGPDQTLRHMERVLPTIGAELAIVTIFADNDFGDLMRNKMFQVADDGRLVAHAFAVDPELEQKFGDGLGTTAIWRFAQRVRRGMRADRATDIAANSTPAALLTAAHQEVEKWIRGSEIEYRDYIIDGNPNVRFLFEDHFDADVAVAPDSESARYKLRLLRAVLGQIAEVARAAEVPLALVVIPSPFDLCGPKHGGVVDRVAHPDYRSAAMTERVEGMANELGVPCINLFEIFAANVPDALYFLAPDNHWNAAGQSLAADAVGEFLLEEDLFEPR